MVVLHAVFYQHRYSLKIFPILSSLPSLSHIHTYTHTNISNTQTTPGNPISSVRQSPLELPAWLHHLAISTTSDSKWCVPTGFCFGVVAKSAAQQKLLIQSLQQQPHLDNTICDWWHTPTNRFSPYCHTNSCFNKHRQIVYLQYGHIPLGKRAIQNKTSQTNPDPKGLIPPVINYKPQIM